VRQAGRESQAETGLGTPPRGARPLRGLGLASAFVAAWLSFGPMVLADVAITIDYTYDTSGFFNPTSHPERRAAMEAAAATLSRLSDNLQAITPSGNNTWKATFWNTDGSDNSTTLTNPAIAANTLVIYVGAGALGSGTLGIGAPGGFSDRGVQTWLNTVSARGQAGALLAQPTDFGPWGGSVAFNADPVGGWYFGLAARGLGAGQNDFYSVATHELAHALGFGTADSWTTGIAGLTFAGAASVAANGGVPVPLDEGLGHWADGTWSTVYGQPQEAAMGPYLTVGTRKRMTALDWAGLTDVGWQPTSGALEWSGASTTAWQSAANWAGRAPTLGYVATFNAHTVRQPQLTQNEFVDGVAFRTAGWAVGGQGQTLTVGPAGISSAGQGTSTITPKVFLDSDSTWNVDAANQLVLDGGLDGGAQTLTKTGDGKLVLDGPQSYDAGALLDVEAGTVALDSDAGAAGVNLAVDASGGTVDFGSSQHLKSLHIGAGGSAVITASHAVIVLDSLQFDWASSGLASVSPEPATLALVAPGLVAAWRRKRA
jgi:hypothetical protein